MAGRGDFVWLTAAAARVCSPCFAFLPTVQSLRPKGFAKPPCLHRRITLPYYIIIIIIASHRVIDGTPRIICIQSGSSDTMRGPASAAASSPGFIGCEPVRALTSLRPCRVYAASVSVCLRARGCVRVCGKPLEIIQRLAAGLCTFGSRQVYRTLAQCNTAAPHGSLAPLAGWSERLPDRLAPP